MSTLWYTFEGFKSRVLFFSILDPTIICSYISEVIDAGFLGPLFKVSLLTSVLVLKTKYICKVLFFGNIRIHVVYIFRCPFPFPYAFCPILIKTQFLSPECRFNVKNNLI